MADVPAGKVEPYIPASKKLPELTIGVILLGCILSMVLAGANAYLGMFAGMTVSASVPAAVISMGLFRLFRRGNILQNNAVQTAAASGEGLASGAIFTLPALVILGVWTKEHGGGNAFPYVQTTLIAAFGGILGVLFTIPLRRALIIDQPLQFPEGVATAEVLKVGAEGGGGVGILLFTGAIGAFVKLGATGLKIWAEVVERAKWVTRGVPLDGGINCSPALLSVGYIVGFNVAAVIFAGAAMNRWIAVPLFALLGDAAHVITDKVGDHGVKLTLAQVLDTKDLSAIDAAGLYHKYVTRFLGVGGMLVGGVWSLFKLRKSLLGGITAGLAAYRKRRDGGTDATLRTEHDMPMNIILILIGVSVIPLFFIFWQYTPAWIAAVMAVVMLVAGFLFSAVASYMAGLVGSSNNPVSGITISTILVAALLLLGLGLPSPAGPIAAILIGGVVCCSAAIGGDNLQDLKCGQLVGSTPWKQQVMQILGVVVAALVMAPMLNLLNNAYTIGSEHLAAPQANLMGTVAFGVFDGGLPWNIIAIGAAIAAAVIAIDQVLEHRGAKVRIPVMAFAVGVYLPFELNVPIFLGGIIAWLVNRKLDKMQATPERRTLVERMGMLAAAGFITGESLMGIGLAIPVAAMHSENAIALAVDAGGNPQYANFAPPALAFVAFALFLLHRLAFAQDRTKPVK